MRFLFTFFNRCGEQTFRGAQYPNWRPWLAKSNGPRMELLNVRGRPHLTWSPSGAANSGGAFGGDAAIDRDTGKTAFRLSVPITIANTKKTAPARNARAVSNRPENYFMLPDLVPP